MWKNKTSGNKGRSYLQGCLQKPLNNYDQIKFTKNSGGILPNNFYWRVEDFSNKSCKKLDSLPLTSKANKVYSDSRKHSCRKDEASQKCSPSCVNKTLLRPNALKKEKKVDFREF